MRRSELLQLLDELGGLAAIAGDTLDRGVSGAELSVAAQAHLTVDNCFSYLIGTLPFVRATNTTQMTVADRTFRNLVNARLAHLPRGRRPSRHELTIADLPECRTLEEAFHALMNSARSGQLGDILKNAETDVPGDKLISLRLIGPINNAVALLRVQPVADHFKWSGLDRLFPYMGGPTTKDGLLQLQLASAIRHATEFDERVFLQIGAAMRRS